MWHHALASGTSCVASVLSVEGVCARRQGARQQHGWAVCAKPAVSTARHDGGKRCKYSASAGEGEAPVVTWHLWQGSQLRTKSLTPWHCLLQSLTTCLPSARAQRTMLPLYPARLSCRGSLQRSLQLRQQRRRMPRRVATASSQHQPAQKHRSQASPVRQVALTSAPLQRLACLCRSACRRATRRPCLRPGACTEWALAAACQLRPVPAPPK